VNAIHLVNWSKSISELMVRWKQTNQKIGKKKHKFAKQAKFRLANLRLRLVDIPFFRCQNLHYEERPIG